jgi:hypothetical protein
MILNINKISDDKEIEYDEYIEKRKNIMFLSKKITNNSFISIVNNKTKSYSNKNKNKNKNKNMNSFDTDKQNLPTSGIT